LGEDGSGLADYDGRGDLKPGGEELNIIATYNLLFNAELMVEAGVGYALCLDKLVNTMDISELCFRPLAESAGGWYGYCLEKISDVLKGDAEIFGAPARIVL